MKRSLLCTLGSSVLKMRRTIATACPAVQRCFSVGCTAQRTFVARAAALRTFHSTTARQFMDVGDRVPSVDLFEGDPTGRVPLRELCGGKRCVFFAVPGAFTPTCSQRHLPSYIEAYEELMKRADVVACVSVNDAWVMQAWGEHTGAADLGIRMLADPTGSFTAAMDAELEAPKLGGLRSRRYSMIVEDGRVTHLNLETPGDLNISLPDTVLQQLDSMTN